MDIEIAASGLVEDTNSLFEKDMKEFYSDEQFVVKSRGTVHILTLNPNDSIKVGETIILDGTEQVVDGVERFNIAAQMKMDKERKVAIWTRGAA